MKQVFYKGLLALTIAFGMTSCDKNEMDIDTPAVGVIVSADYSKVSFGESSIGIELPKLKADAASKSAVGFSHIYSSDRQMLSISNAGGEVWAGSYSPAVIDDLQDSAGNAANIILANGDYTVATTNPGNANADPVIGYLPYISDAAFTLSSDTGVIELVAELQRGFIIVDVENTGDTRVSAASISIGEGDSAALILDDDATGDYYGYLLPGTYNVDVEYTVDNVARTQSVSREVIAGEAYTINLDLTADSPEPTITYSASSEVVTITEVALGVSQVVALTGVADADLFDIASRTETTTQTLHDDVIQVELEMTGVTPWMVLDGDDYSQANFGNSGTLPADGDSTAPADTTAPVITLASDLPVDGGLIATDYTFTITSDDADAVIVWSKNGSVVSGESGLTYTTSFGNANGDKVISVSVTDAADNAASESLTFTVSEPAVDGVDSWEDNGDTIGGDETFTNDGSPVLGYSYNGGAFGSLVDAQAAADAAIATEGDTVVMIQVQSVQSRLSQISAVIQPEIYVVNGDQDGDIEAGAMRSTQVVTAAVVDGAADDAAPVAGDDVSYTVSNEITNTDVTWTSSTSGGDITYTASDSDYSFTLTGSFNDVQISGISFPEDVVISISAYFNGAATDLFPATPYTLRASNVLVTAAPLADVATAIQTAINN